MKNKIIAIVGILLIVVGTFATVKKVSPLSWGMWREYARTSGTFAARMDQIKITIMAASLVLLGIIAAVLSIGFIIAIVVVEIWQPLLVAFAVIAGLATSIIWLRRPRA